MAIRLLALNQKPTCLLAINLFGIVQSKKSQLLQYREENRQCYHIKLESRNTTKYQLKQTLGTQLQTSQMQNKIDNHYWRIADNATTCNIQRNGTFLQNLNIRLYSTT
jgi:hypothetical protein